ncbi:hypothetical protein AXE80_08700 [Wenyingzhuangia fucanilytica]|uniref:Uncharacterized protein n=1 Tax=Wenyingzhuangia fucanilytica TaxID=1790137 RepID=A0A1B1Y6D3_9FLAO|nr:hypothetical protein [Wenyingzhuangia fucanilytica]ANW96351.1 hypothetical protein AXE80_08700 [Wenyingzhuangia fucanilytica]
MLNKILNIKENSYSFNLDKEVLKNKIEAIFKQQNLNIVGEFTTENEFSIHDKWTLISWVMPNLKRKSAYLKGTILSSKKGISIKTNTHSNTILAVFSFFSIFLGLIISILSNQNKQLLIVGMMLILLGVLYYLIGLYFRNRLLKNFEKHLSL